MSREELIRNPPFTLTEVDVATLRQTDEEYEPYTWEHLKGVIETNTLDTLARVPSDLENYIHFTYHVKATYKSMMNFILQHKIQWIPASIPSDQVLEHLPLVPANLIPFASPSDYKIRRNDWPYGTLPDIQHLVVWLKPRIIVDEEGDPTEESKKLIENFVGKTFRARMGNVKEKVMWFRNRTQWQSVRALEHIHVLLHGAEQELIEELTGQEPGYIEQQKWKNGKRIAE